MIEKEKMGKFGEIVYNLWSFLIFWPFSYLKSYDLFKTEQKLTKVRMEMSLFLGAIFSGLFFSTFLINDTHAKIYLFSSQK